MSKKHPINLSDCFSKKDLTLFLPSLSEKPRESKKLFLGWSKYTGDFSAAYKWGGKTGVRPKVGGQKPAI